MTWPFIDITGQRFGRLTVLQRVGDTQSRWLCVCDCGAEHISRGPDLRRGRTKACRGCSWHRKHGHSNGYSHSPEYTSWNGATQRCHNPGNDGYHNYGARGITVCDEWRASFEAFLRDMGPRPPGTALERIDNDRGYEPSNCRWATSAEQARNTRRTRLNPEVVKVLRWGAKNGIPIRLLARLHGVYHSTVCGVVSGARWGDIARSGVRSPAGGGVAS